MKVITGLGNPGGQYEKTRHNLGFRAVELLADRFNVKIIKSKFKALIGETVLNGEKVMLVKPMTFMNLSGDSVREIVSYYNLDISDIVIIYDDHALSAGSVRVRESGSDGGHNGIKSIISRLGTQDFKRIRIGIGRKPANRDLADYVLSGFADEETADVEKSLADACDCAELILKGRTSEAMNRYNRRISEKEATTQNSGDETN